MSVAFGRRRWSAFNLLVHIRRFSAVCRARNEAMSIQRIPIEFKSADEVCWKSRVVETMRFENWRMPTGRVFFLIPMLHLK